MTMKITGIALEPVGGASAEDTRILRLATDVGLEGVAVGVLSDIRPAEEAARDVLIGADPSATVSLWKRMLDHFEASSGESESWPAAAMLDMAVWDLKAKANGEPLWRTLGAKQPAARAILRLAAQPADPAAIPKAGREAVRRLGFEAGILPVGFDMAAEVGMAGELLEDLAASTPCPELILDCGDRWAPDDALHVVGAWEQRMDIARIQAGAGAWAPDDCKRVSASLAAAVSCADGLVGKGYCCPPLRGSFMDVVVVDPTLRGITGSLQLADAAYGYELPVVLAATMGDIGAHLAGAMPYFMGMEVAISGDRRESTPDSGARVQQGRVLAGDRPGLGWTLGGGPGE